MAEQAQLSGPDLSAGIDAATLADGGKLLGHAQGEAVMIARIGDEFFAIGATCSHYGGPLSEGAIVGDTVRCPWHHAASVCATAKRCARRRSIRSRVGPSSGVVKRSS